MNIFQQTLEVLRLSKKFNDYKPYEVNFKSIYRWLNQYNKDDQELLIKLLKQVIYYDEKTIDSFLQDENEKLLESILDDGLTYSKIVYVTIDETASSSHVMVNKVRDLGRLERKGCKLIDSKNLIDLNKVLNEIGRGVIIYVDDFLGTGYQFCESRDFIARNIATLSINFSEFILAPCICQEAKLEIEDRGIVPITKHCHVIEERPLHNENISQLLSKEEKVRVLELSRKINKKFPLGFKNLATMVVIYRNSPNSTPCILRGDLGQKEIIGILPRTTDLPIK